MKRKDVTSIRGQQLDFDVALHIFGVSLAAKTAKIEGAQILGRGVVQA